jgi:hypothetical protein
MPDATYGSGITRTTASANVAVTTGTTTFTIDHPGGTGIRYVDFQVHTLGLSGPNTITYSIILQSFHVVDSVWRTFTTVSSGTASYLFGGVVNQMFAHQAGFEGTLYSVNEGTNTPTTCSRFKITPNIRALVTFNISTNGNGNLYYTVTDEV